MSRVIRYQLGYVLALAGIAALCVAILQQNNWSVLVALVLAVALFVPGRIQGILLRDLFRGRYELDKDNPAEALSHLQRFLLLVKSQPWRGSALWLSWSVYTPNAEAMTLNNIGVAQLATGNSDAAVAAWRQALTLDPLYPIPHVNLAVIADALGAKATSDEHLAEARRLGFTGRKLDQTIHKAQSLLARIESKGPQL